MILIMRRVVCIFLTLVLLSAECYSIRINYQDAEVPKEESIEYNDDTQSKEVETQPAPVPIKKRVNEETRDNLLLQAFSLKDGNILQKLMPSPAKSRVSRQASAPTLYPNLTPSPYQSRSVQYYNNSSPNSNSQYGQTVPYNQQWQRHNNSNNYPVNAGHPSYNPNTYGPSGYPNPYVQYNNSQSGLNGPHPQNYPSIHPGNYSNQPNHNPNIRPTTYPSYTKFLPNNPTIPQIYNPSQRPPYYLPGGNTSQNTSLASPSYPHPYNPSQKPRRPHPPTYNSSSSYPNYPHSSPTNPTYNPSQRPPYYQPGHGFQQNTSSSYSNPHTPYQTGHNTSSNYPYNPPANPSYNPSQRPPYYQPGYNPSQNTSSSYPNPYQPPYQVHNTTSNYPLPNNPANYTNQRPPYSPQNSLSPYPPNYQNSTNSFNTTPRSLFGQYPSNPSYNPYPYGQNPAGFPDTNFRPNNREEDLFKPVLPKGPSRPYDPYKSPSENFADFGY